MIHCCITVPWCCSGADRHRQQCNICMGTGINIVLVGYTCPGHDVGLSNHKHTAVAAAVNCKKMHGVKHTTAT